MSAAEEFFKRVSDLADELFDPEDTQGKEKYVNEHMKQKGFKAVTSWADPDDGDNGNVSGLFGNSTRERRNTRRSNDNNRRRSSGGGSLFYDD